MKKRQESKRERIGKSKIGKTNKTKNRFITVLLGSSLFFVICVIIFAIAIYSVHFFSIISLRVMFRAVLFLIGAIVYIILIEELIKVYKIKYSVLE